MARTAFLAALGFSMAAEAADEGPPIVVTASRTEAADTAGVVALSRIDLEATPAPTALDALDRLAGVRAFSKGGAGGGTYLSIRGGEPNFTLVLLDGARVTDPSGAQGGAFDFAQLDPALIERIEVYRGALSAVQGADALSGVVNIALRYPTARETAATARAFGSTAGEAGGDASLSAGWDGGGVLIAGGAYDSGRLTRGSDLTRAQGLARAAHEGGGARLSLTGLYAATDRRVFPEDSGGPRLATLRQRERRTTGFGLVSFLAERTEPAPFRPAVRVSWSRQTSDSATPPIAPGALSGVPAIRADTTFDRLEAQAEARWTRGGVALAAGGGVIDEDGSATGAVDFGVVLPTDYAVRRSIAYGFGEATLATGRLTLTGGVRHDAPTTARARWTGRAAARWTPLDGGPALFASHAGGFKLPSFFALAYPLIANPRLKPERAQSWEAGVEQRLGARARLRAAAFRTDYRDLIDFDPERFTNVNRASVRAEGIEAEGAATLGAFTLTGALTWLGVDNRDGPPLRSRPGFDGAGRIEWAPRAGMRAFVAVQRNASFFDSSVPTGLVRLPGFTTLDLGGSAELSGGVRLDLTLRNVTDERFEQAVGFPEPRATLRATLSTAF